MCVWKFNSCFRFPFIFFLWLCIFLCFLLLVYIKKIVFIHANKAWVNYAKHLQPVLTLQVGEGNYYNTDVAILLLCFCLSMLYLRGNLSKWYLAFKFGLCPLGRPQWDMKKPKRISALRISFQSYNRFTEILAYGKVHAEKSNDNISTWNFAHR
jgi:hypothetical protein